MSSSEILCGPALQIGGAESGPFFGVSFGPAQPARGLTHICVFGGSFGIMVISVPRGSASEGPIRSQKTAPVLGPRSACNC